MLIIRKSQTNNLIATVSMNKTLPNPYYLFSFQHIASKERVSFFPQVITSNIRYDKFRFVEAQTTNLSVVPPQVFFEYLGQYYYSIYETITSASTDPSLAYNKLESGRAWVIVGDDNTQECFFEPYISNDEDFSQVIYVSEEEEACIYPTPSITPTMTSTPTNTPTFTPTPSFTPTTTPTTTCPITTQYLEVELFDTTKFKLILWNDALFTSAANANCDYNISGTAYGDLGTVFTGVETILSGQHQHQFNLAPILQPGEVITGFTVHSYTLSGCPCPVNLILPNQTTPTPTPTQTFTPTPSTTPPNGYNEFIVASGATALDACNALSSGITFTAYANIAGGPGQCAPCVPFNCFACVNTSDTWWLDAGFTIPLPDMWIANYINEPSSNPSRMEIVGQQIVGGTFTSC